MLQSIQWSSEDKFREGQGQWFWFYIFSNVSRFLDTKNSWNSRTVVQHVWQQCKYKSVEQERDKSWQDNCLIIRIRSKVCF